MVAISFFWIHIYWYGIFYAVSFLIGFFYIKYLLNHLKSISIINKDEFLDDLLMYVVLWVLFWWRFGYVFFYNFSYFLESPLKVFYVWEWWMAFAGAFLWVGLSLYLLAKKYKINFFSLTDIIVSILPFGLWIWRIWNYLNWELYGKACPNFLETTFLCKDYGLWWLNISNQLLESFFEWWLLLFIFQYLVWKKWILLSRWKLTTIFVIYYATIRFFLEFIRYHPNDYILYFWLSISQYFMILFFIIWLLFLFLNNKKSK